MDKVEQLKAMDLALNDEEHGTLRNEIAVLTSNYDEEQKALDEKKRKFYEWMAELHGRVEVVMREKLRRLATDPHCLICGRRFKEKDVEAELWNGVLVVTFNCACQKSLPEDERRYWTLTPDIFTVSQNRPTTGTDWMVEGVEAPDF